MTGIVFGEQPRWHDGRLWFSDWGTHEVIAVDPDGTTEVMYRGSSFPLCVDWLRDGRLLVVDASTGRLLVMEARQTLYIVANEWNGPENMFKGERSGQLLTVAAPAAAAGWPGR